MLPVVYRDHFDATINTLKFMLTTLQNDIHTMASHNQVNNLHNALNNGLSKLTSDILTNLQKVSQELTVAIAHVNQAAQPEAPGTLERVFFSDAQAALTATNALLSNVPRARYPITVGDLPREQLFGQLHAIHANTLEWLTHMDNQLNSIEQKVNTCARQNTVEVATKRDIDELIRVVRELGSHHPQAQMDISPLLDEFRAIKTQITEQNPTEALQLITSVLSTITSGHHTAPVMDQLPHYQAEHPTATCRTHGTLIFDELHAKVPMDVTGYPPSSSLQMHLKVKREAHDTAVSFALYNADALLLSRTVRTPHEMLNLPWDAFALIHHNCPQFIYKMNRQGLC